MQTGEKVAIVFTDSRYQPCMYVYTKRLIQILDELYFFVTEKKFLFK